jgi:hypothetical protein
VLDLYKMCKSALSLGTTLGDLLQEARTLTFLFDARDDLGRG